jgi:hypothetical protein
MSPEKFRTIGAALYGPAWQRALASALGINERAVRHYAAQSNPREIPESMDAELARLLYAQAERATALAKSLKIKTGSAR